MHISFLLLNNHHKPDKNATIMQKKSLRVIKEELCTNSHIEKADDCTQVLT